MIPWPLVAEDNWSTEEGAVLSFSKLAAEPGIAAFIGPTMSFQVHAIADDVDKAGKPMMIGGTDPTLTHMGNHWLFRCRPNDSYSARVMVDFGVNTLGKRKWAIVHNTDPFGTSGKNALADSLKAIGVE